MKTSIISAMAAIAMMITNVNNANATTTASMVNVPATISVAAPSNSMTLTYYRVNSCNKIHRFVYTTDNQGRVVEKTKFGWNENENTWFPIDRYQIHYGSETNEVTYGIWNNASQGYYNGVKTQYFDAQEYSEIISLPRYSK